MVMELYHEKYSLFVRLKKNYSGKNILKGQHFRLLCDRTSDPESTYLEKVEQLRTNENCFLDQDKYDECMLPFPCVQVKCEDLEDITEEVLSHGQLFFTESSFFGSKEGRDELQKENRERRKLIRQMANDAFGSVSDSSDSDSDEDEDIKD